MVWTRFSCPSMAMRVMVVFRQIKGNMRNRVEQTLASALSEFHRQRPPIAASVPQH